METDQLKHLKMERKKTFNNSLHNVSKKRLEAIKNGTWKPKPRKPMKQVSDKARKRIKSYRETCFALYGHRCFLCGRTMPESQLDCHHCLGRINGDDPKYIVPLCNRFSGCRAHNHNGMDARFHELQKEILSRIE